MPRAFDLHEPVRVAFGVGVSHRTHELLEELGAERVLVVAHPRHPEGGEALVAALGSRAVGLYDRIRQHVPEDLIGAAVAHAEEHDVDWVVSHGGGTAVGFAKAIALSLPVTVGAVVTTYAGSERTSIWGMTGPEGKRTGRDPRVRPSLVVYDPELTMGLAPTMSYQSLLNALAHVTEASWKPETDALAREASDAARQVIRALDALAAAPDSLEARTEAMYGAFLAAAMIERSTLGLQHGMAHVLGGSFDVLHASAHTTVLPYSLGFNGRTSPDAMARLAPALGDDPPAALYDRARALGLPHSLKELGLTRADLPTMVDKILERPYRHQRPLEREALAELVDDAYHGRRPSLHSRRRGLDASGPHAALRATERGTDLADADAVLIAVHGRGAVADRIAHDIETLIGPQPGLCVLAPQALDNAWYPKGFAAPLDENQPFLDSALSVLDAAWEVAIQAVAPSRVVVAGFSQGGCLALTWARTRDITPGALLALSSAQLDAPGGYANLAETAVTLSKSEADPWVSPERFASTAALLKQHVAQLEVRVGPGDEHRLTEDDGVSLRRAVETALSASRP